MKNIYYIFILFLSFQIGFSQSETDTLVKENFKYKKLILPAGLMAIGGVLKIKSVQNNVQQNAQNLFGSNFNTKADDFIQFVPTVQMFAGNLLGFKSKNGYLQMGTNFLISNLIVTGAVLAIKTETFDKRPDNTGNNSFPSGHTTAAFNNATLLFFEYKDSNIWYAASGYIFATATGVLRVANNRHWSGDVATGAGLGIAVGTIVSYWNPFNFEHKKSKILGYPIIGNSNYGLGVLYKID